VDPHRPTEDERRLCSLLTKACAELEKREDPSTPVPLWKFLRDRIPEIQAGTIRKIHQKELWRIFAPSSEWDDLGGGADLGNSLFEVLNRLYGN